MTLDLDAGWYAEYQLQALGTLVYSVVGISGLVIEVGCWKGNSTIKIAKTLTDGMVCAVDTWEGSVDESPNHDTVILAKEQNIEDIFRHNIQLAGVQDNIFMFKMNWREFFEKHVHGMSNMGIRLLHIDGSHDYVSVRDNIAAALPYMVLGGVICGDDIQTAHKGREDLQGGVERAVQELLPEYVPYGNFWYWRKR
jgi:SAM-dependent methyltransferase